MGVRDISVARRSTVCICNEKGEHFGQGLLLFLANEGWTVLTCHHVVAPLDEQRLHIAVPDAFGTLGHPIKATYDPERSRPTLDAAVLRIPDTLLPDQPRDQPFLHYLNPFAYDGTLPDRAVCLSYWKGNSFDARIATTTQLNVAVEKPGPWPNAPVTYQLPYVFRLAEPTDARKGISGSVVLYDKGVLGLAHFSRPGGSDQEREVYLVPLSLWADGWLTLQSLIEPLIDARLRNVAKIKTPNQVEIGKDIVIAGYRPEVYISFNAEEQANKALESVGGVIIVGKPKSGKTRLAWRLMEKRQNAFIVMPFESNPPVQIETSAFYGKEIILFFDDLHRTTLATDPLEWRRRMEAVTGQPCLIICTARDGKDLKRVEDSATAQLFDLLGNEACIFISRSGKRGSDLTQTDGLALASQLGIEPDEFNRRFDGTPGSLTLDLTAMRHRYRQLKDEDGPDGVCRSRLLDAAKIAYAASQPRLRLSVLKAISENIRGNRPLSAEAWEALQRRTSEEGFGSFDLFEDEFYTYKPYLESCVDIEPSNDDFIKLIPILVEGRDGTGLLYLGYAFGMGLKDNLKAEECLRLAINVGNKEAGTLLGIILATKVDKRDESERYCRQQIEAGNDNFNYGLACILSTQSGREAEAEAAFKNALNNNKTKEYDRLFKATYGKFLSGLKGREPDAEKMLQEASQEGDISAVHDLGNLIFRQPGRQNECIELIGAAIKRHLEIMQSDTEESTWKSYGLTAGQQATNDIGKLYYSKGHFLSKMSGREQDAETFYKLASEKNNTDAFLALGLLLLKTDRLHDAELYFRKGLNAGVSECTFGLGLVLRLQGYYKEAEDYLWRAIQNGLVDGYRDLAIAFAEQGRFGEAEHFLHIADDHGVDIVLNLAFVLQKQKGREIEAFAEFRRQLQKGNKEAFSHALQMTMDHKDIQFNVLALLRDAIETGLDVQEQLAIHLAKLVIDKNAYHFAVEAEKRLQALVEKRNLRAKTMLGLLLFELNRQTEGMQLIVEARAEGDGLAEELVSSWSKL